MGWKRELNLCWRIYLWYMRAGLIAVPFGVLYAFAALRLGHGSKPALLVCAAAALLAVFRLQGMPPEE